MRAESRVDQIEGEDFLRCSLFDESPPVDFFCWRVLFEPDELWCGVRGEITFGVWNEVWGEYSVVR
jgi:hypothetical protein